MHFDRTFFSYSASNTAGYASQTGFTYGTRLFGVDLAFSKKQPLEIGSSIRF